jgi:hypothetical protein
LFSATSVRCPLRDEEHAEERRPRRRQIASTGNARERPEEPHELPAGRLLGGHRGEHLRVEVGGAPPSGRALDEVHRAAQRFVLFLEARIVLDRLAHLGRLGIGQGAVEVAGESVSGEERIHCTRS